MIVFLCNVCLALNLLSSVWAQKCTTTSTVSTSTSIHRKTISTLPSLTYYQYDSTVLIGTQYTGPHPYIYPDPANPISCQFSTTTGPKVSCTRTVTVSSICTRTTYVYPGPVIVTKAGVLTTRVPSFCTNVPRDAKGNVPDGNAVYPLAYPYYGQTVVDCCIYCSKQYYNDVAAAYIAGSNTCECLVNTNGSRPHPNQFCPLGLEPYKFRPMAGGNALPGPCYRPPT